MPIDSFYNTGVDDMGVALGDAVDDPHYDIVLGPTGGPEADQTVPDDDFPIPPWLENNAGSRWIGPVEPDANAAPGTYAYETTFDLTGLDATNAAISGWWATDDGSDGILLNGVAIPSAATQGFTAVSWFGINSAAAAAAGAPLQEGVNTLTFRVTNGGDAANPTGLRVDRAYGRAAPLGSVPIPGLYNTGVDDNGIPLEGGAADPHYTQTVAPEGAPGPATAMAGPPSPPWVQQTASSRWIGPNDPGGNAQAGMFEYEISFDLSGLDPTSAVITGLWSADNVGGDILLNGVATENPQQGSFVDLSPFSISVADGDTFLPGLNKLTFLVENAPPDNNPIGLRVESLVAHAMVPEPTSLALLLAGGLLLIMRRR
jgi:hypothetical protein